MVVFPPDGVDFDSSGWEPRESIHQITYAPDGADLGLIIALQWAAHELYLALGGIPKKGLVEADQVVPMPSGVHQIELKLDRVKQGSAVRVSLDDLEVVVVEAPASWKRRSGSEGGLQYRSSTHLPADFGSPAVWSRL